MAKYPVTNCTGYGTSNSLRSQNVPHPKARRNTNVTPVYGMKTINKANRRDERLLLQQAINLLHTLRKEYHIIEEKI